MDFTPFLYRKFHHSVFSVSQGIVDIHSPIIKRPFLAEPVPLGFRKSRDGQLGTPEGLLTPALVQTLQTELAREKEEHRHTWREAAAQVSFH